MPVKKLVAGRLEDDSNDRFIKNRMKNESVNKFCE